MVNQDRLVAEFLELVQVDSETKHEAEIAKVLTEKFTALGLKVVEDDSQQRTGHGAGNLICTLEALQGGIDSILLSSHMDTVGPGVGIKPVIKDAIIYSDGTTILGSDDKAGVAAILETIRILKEHNLQHGQIQVVISAGEESGLVGAKVIDTSLLDAKFGFAIDSHDKVGNVVVAAPSRAKIKAVIHGKTAHAGVAPEKGINAIQIAAAAINKMPLGRIDEDTTANLGRIEGGSQLNVVCEEVTVLAEARSLINEKLEQQLQVMKEAFEATAEEMGGSAKVEMEILYPGFKFSEADEVVQIAQRAAAKIERPCSLLRSGGGSDANVFSGYGIPTVNLAVGYEEIHTVNERMPIVELVKITEMLLAVIEETVRK
ncbi:M20/M25/M40 family metallo-hydrolase [Mesobacillus subterraneus]|uniref:M20/M25/M40 family metallo-hydrolase n=1 Tax=Mesobacillus subterraneus TaxID=285983 RepID=UPI00273FF778|nr:M20/M25/M40 family metallo-hydrolase [Mesobacillus subterraneus]WLR54554.1 M20/M25/M40 family metallo-hydrolase [Mesobacillus subterraneus]